MIGPSRGKNDTKFPQTEYSVLYIHVNLFTLATWDTDRTHPRIELITPVNAVPGKIVNHYSNYKVEKINMKKI